MVQLPTRVEEGEGEGEVAMEKALSARLPPLGLAGHGHLKLPVPAHAFPRQVSLAPAFSASSSFISSPASGLLHLFFCMELSALTVVGHGTSVPS